MALSPSIPTSFVPKQPVSPGSKKRYSSGENIFLVVSLIIVAFAIAASAAVYLYSNYLVSAEKSKGAELVAAQGSISADTVQQFIDLRDRLTVSKTLLDQHIELSQFFTLLESITEQDVHYSMMTITVADDNSATLVIAGQAASFNALASESNAFAAQKDIQSAVFSGIVINKDGTIGFTLNANIVPSLITESAAPTTPTLLPSTPTQSAPATPSFSATSAASTKSTAPSTTPVVATPPATQTTAPTAPTTSATPETTDTPDDGSSNLPPTSP